MRHYEEAAPGSGRQIIASWERQAAHRRELERLALQAEIENQQIAMLGGLLLALTALTVAVMLIVSGHHLFGVTLGIVDFGALAAVFASGQVGSTTARFKALAEMKHATQVDLRETSYAGEE